MSETTIGGFFASAPMTHDRTEGWRYFREPGAVYQREGLWYLTSQEAVRFAHTHPEIFSSEKAFANFGSPVPEIPIAVDPPDHVRYRRVLDPFFAPRVINGIEESLRQQVRDLIDEFKASGICDIMQTIAKLYPTQVIMTMFGLPLDDRDMFLAWTKAILESQGDNVKDGATAEAKEFGSRLFTYLQAYIQRKREAPGDDVLSAILALRGDDAWTDDEVLGMSYLFTIAGLDTVTSSIGFVMHHLAANPNIQREVRANPDLLGPLIEEVLRLELPAPFTPRVVLEDVEVCGTTIPAGSFCFLALACANREGRDNPDEIDLSQADRGHLSFGGGIHRCLGSHLARRELRIVVEEFHAAISDYSIAPGFTPSVHWPSGTLHLESLPLVFAPVAS